MADIKDEFNLATVTALGAELGRAWSGFPIERWQERAAAGLDDLRLMQRVDLLAGALVENLPAEFDAAATIIERALRSDTFTGWMTLPVGYFVAQVGIEDPQRALPVLAALTPRFSSEFAIRAFLDAHQEITFRHFDAWVTSPDEHVRRLVSEGSRPRLPWARQLRSLIADPTPTVALLDRLYDDPSPYVRRSVANHLNDISKDHPARAVHIAHAWLSRSPHRVDVVRHGLRSLVKRGDPDALALLGFPTGDRVRLVEIACEPVTITIGESVVLRATLTATTETRAAIDYVVHYQGVAGPKRGKVFRLTTRTLAAGEPTTIERRHTFAHVSIRRIRPGSHRIEVQVNGRVLGGVDIAVT